MTRSLRDLIAGTHTEPATAARVQLACAEFAAWWRTLDRKRDLSAVDLRVARLGALATLGESIEAQMTTPSFRNEIQPLLVELARHVRSLDTDTADAWSSQHRVTDRQAFTSVGILTGQMESRAVARILCDTYWLNLDAELMR